MWLVPVLGLSCKILTGLQFANCCYSESPPTQLFAKFFFEDAVAARFWEASSSFDFSKFEQAGYERDAHWLIRLPKMPQHWNCQFRGRRRRRSGNLRISYCNSQYLSLLSMKLQLWKFPQIAQCRSLARKSRHCHRNEEVRAMIIYWNEVRSPKFRGFV